MNQEKIGKFIKKIRKDHNLSQQAFAQKLGVSFQAVSKWENGKNLPDISTLQEIKKQFNVNIDEIIEGALTPKSKKKKYYLILIIILFLILINVIIFKNLNLENNFEFNEIKSLNNDFQVSGSVVKSLNRTSLIINNVNYTGEADFTVYQKLSCNLYEEKDNVKNLITVCDNDNNKTLIEYLENLKIKMDHVTVNCPMFTTSSISIEISALDKQNRTITYKIPIEISDDSCGISTSS